MSNLSFFLSVFFPFRKLSTIFIKLKFLSVDSLCDRKRNRVKIDCDKLREEREERERDIQTEKETQRERERETERDRKRGGVKDLVIQRE